ncbi:thiamine biosynthesis protein ThiS [Acidobacteria bacterium Mor1]|nr:thiamine biosynthesis protein ThiS [Acidobacteria bacterium Mor1]
MQIRLNGENRDVSAASVLELVRELGHDPGAFGVALALNEEVVHRARWQETPLSEGDRVEIVTAVQGG